jgi:hypothetical protein
MMRSLLQLFGVLGLLIATSVSAQQRLIFDPDDSVDPRQHDETAFISRLVIGVASDFIDDYRPVHHDATFALLTNSIYWSSFQFDYKHSEVRAGIAPSVVECRCPNLIYFPTPPPPGATPAAPTPGAKDTLQWAFYGPSPLGRPAEPPVMLRYRLSVSRQTIDETVKAFATGKVVSRLSGREKSIGLDADTYFRIGRHDVYGSLLFARTVSSGTIDNHSQSELAYMSRFPAVAIHSVLVRATLTVGGVSGRRGTALNVVNPAFEAFWHDPKTRANFHLVWSPQSTNSGAGGWETHHQIAFFVDRALYVHLFRARTDSSATGRE